VAAATVGDVAGAVLVDVPGVVAAVLPPVVADGAVFTATGDPEGCVVATGADAGALFAVAIVFAIATSVPCIPVSVVSTAVSCDGVRVVLAEIEVANWANAPERVLNVALNVLI
jgi:hypothetical protein